MLGREERCWKWGWKVESVWLIVGQAGVSLLYFYATFNLILERISYLISDVNIE